VNGVVTLDGTPVEGATVDFVSDDGKSYSGFTDAGGNFTLNGPDQKSGVPAGTYKVTVTKQRNMTVDTSGGDEAQKGDLSKMMSKMGKEGVKEAAKGKSAMMMSNPMLKSKSGLASGGVKSDLPVLYASKETTPLTVKVPPDTQRVPIELKSK
jgi:hypothetical protein